MPIISKETWDKFDPTEQKEIRELYSSLIEAMKLEEVGSQRHIVLSGMQDRYISLFGKENLQPQPLTYEDVARELFNNKKSLYIDSDGDILETFTDDTYSDPTYCTSQKQAKKLLAINKLLNVANFLNKDWKPGWEGCVEKKYYISLKSKKISVEYTIDYNNSIVYFRTEELAKQALAILGEDTVRLALGNY